MHCEDFRESLHNLHGSRGQRIHCPVADGSSEILLPDSDGLQRNHRADVSSPR